MFFSIHIVRLIIIKLKVYSTFSWKGVSALPRTNDFRIIFIYKIIRFFAQNAYLYSNLIIKEMNLLNFVSQYPDEASCRAKFKEYRDQEGVVCPHCGGKAHYWKNDKENYECKKCGNGCKNKPQRIALRRAYLQSGEDK